MITQGDAAKIFFDLSLPPQNIKFKIEIGIRHFELRLVLELERFAGISGPSVGTSMGSTGYMILYCVYLN